MLSIQTGARRHLPLAVIDSLRPCPSKVPNKADQLIPIDELFELEEMK